MKTNINKEWVINKWPFDVECNLHSFLSLLSFSYSITFLSFKTHTHMLCVYVCMYVCIYLLFLFKKINCYFFE